MTPDKAHSHNVPGVHGVLGEGGLRLWLIEAIRVLEEVSRVEIFVMVRHCDWDARVSRRLGDREVSEA